MDNITISCFVKDIINKLLAQLQVEHKRLSKLADLKPAEQETLIVQEIYTFE